MVCARGGGRGGRAGIVAGLGMYLLVLMGSPLLHHDLACHVKSPTHCQGCVANPSASRVEGCFGLEQLALPESGTVVGRQQKAPDLTALVPSPGRSPPS